MTNCLYLNETFNQYDQWSLIKITNKFIMMMMWHAMCQQGVTISSQPRDS